MATRSIKGVQVINFLSETNEEMLILRLLIHDFSFCIVEYYRPPGSTQLCNIFELFEKNTYSNIVMLGDFNLPDIQWATNTPAVLPAGRVIAKRLCSFVLRNDLTQHVRFPLT